MTRSEAEFPVRESATAGRLAGIDFGTVRIGVALSDPEQRLASPWDNYARRSDAVDAAYFRRLVAEERVARFVVGLPVHLDGRESRLSAEARRFAQWLGETTGVPVDLFDERFTSHEAEQHLLAAELTSRQRKARRDKLAAQILLASYLESRGRGVVPPERLDDRESGRGGGRGRA